MSVNMAPLYGPDGCNFGISINIAEIGGLGFGSVSDGAMKKVLRLFCL